ncbi:CLUMA_CG003422, isoform A [Clunio marinus]|uniref:CLUMA_CG003422, isoform A n=1 Tax=Clunio marinus TaxID=568069 RepID=A0A1J1HR20_9DIPT|nr:CLUMA_CG003422, isoform A [Clunio marinus]
MACPFKVWPFTLTHKLNKKNIKKTLCR